MKALFVLVFVASVTASLRFVDTSAVDPYDFFRGVLRSAGDREDLDDLMPCLNSVEPALDKMREGLKLIVKGDPENVFNGTAKVLEGLIDLYAIMDPCTQKYPGLHELGNKLQKADPFLTSMKILLHVTQYRPIFNKAIGCLVAEKLDCAGYNGGYLLKLIFVMKLDSSPDVEVFEFIKGFLKGLGEKGDPQKLLDCIKTLEEVIQKIRQSLMYIFSGYIEEILKGIVMLLDAVKEMLQQIKPCMEGLEVLQKLWRAIENADVAKLLKKILLDINRIIAEIGYIIQCFEEADYEGAGYGVGNFLKFLFLS